MPPRSTGRWRVLAALTLALLAVVTAPLAASADTGGDVVRSLDIDIDVRPDGTLEITETYEWDFGSREGLGLTRELAARFLHPERPGMVRVYEYDDFAVTSPSGAPAGVWPREEGSYVAVDIGAPDGSSDRRSGVQTYAFSYTVRGALNAIRGEAGVPDQDELYWNVTGNGWEVVLEEVTTTVTGPVDVIDHACFQGRSSSDGCTALEVGGPQVTARSDRLEPGEELTVMAAFPAGTFGEIAPILEVADPKTESELAAERRLETIDGVTGPPARFLTENIAWLAPLALLGPVGWAFLRIRRHRDLHYVGLTPGTLPGPGTPPPVAQLAGTPTVAVRFAPPDGLRPAEVALLRDKRTTAQAVAVTIVDLAARGYLRIEENEATGLFGRTQDWTFFEQPGGADRNHLRRYERRLLEALFRGRTRVTLSDLRNTFASTMASTQSYVRDEVDARELFVEKRSVFNVRTLLTWAVVVVVLVAIVNLDVVLTLVPGSLALLALAALGLLGAFGVARLATSRAVIQRTARGRALFEQVRGFELYLETAEAEQLRWEEGEDIFSRYLPYAMVFGVAERWAEIFERLEEEGRTVRRPTWYSSRNGLVDVRMYRHLGSAMSSFTSTTSSALSSTPGSSGGSGSRRSGGGRGGGGRSGGGGGGGGGRGR
ncbi:DUF2207 domain-containing protein [Georgenia wangjunii]|uniref:DUF2207 domain-containing protein n=1 Tax=Georgenia wangjunii TaxID=3117730 RepID=UPI002F262C63